MPSVGGMRRTRVFGLVKGSDGARVLRSGRLLLLEPKKPAGDGEDGLAKPKNSSGKNTKGYSARNGSVKGKENGWAHNSKPKQEQAVASKAKPVIPTRVLRSSSRDAVDKDRRRFGNVYTRKRKRCNDADGGSVPERPVMKGIQFSSRQGRISEQKRCLSVLLEGGFSCADGLGELLVSVLFYMKRVGLRLSLLGAFLLSEPVRSAFGTVGIRFSWDPPLNRIGVCKLFGALQLVPLFKVDFSCIPSCFLFMHLHLVFRVKSLTFEHVNNSSDDDDDDDEDPYVCLNDSEADKLSIPVKNESSEGKASLQVADTSRSKIAHPSVRASKLVGRSHQLRSNIGSRGIRKTRSSLRRKRAGSRTVGLQNASGSVVLGLAHIGKSCVSRPVISKNASGRSSITTRSAANGKRPRLNSDLGTVKLRSSTRSAANGKRPRINSDLRTVKLRSKLAKLVQDSAISMSASPKSSQVSVELNPAFHEMAEDSVEANPVLVKSALGGSFKSSSSCSANLLVVEADRCYRITGVTIVQEVSNLSEWVLVVKKDDRTFCSHLAQRSMKPCSFNRVTHDVIWSTDETWKLEFPNRQDWFIFKDLYKECGDRNLPTTTPKVIPVPVVHEVPGYEDTCVASFCRPDYYLSVNNSNEVARALARNCANYDLDSEDEEWLNTFNYKSLGENRSPEILSEDKFELMIDTFEKAFYCNPDDFTDEEAAVSLCKEIAEKEVSGAVYNYWMKKRKQKRSALVRVFQGHQPKRAPLIPKPAFRKKRSFKRQPSLSGRGMQPSLLQGKLIGGEVNNYRFSWQGLHFPAALGAEEDALQEQNAAQKLDEAKESAKRCVESAIEKRQRAQLLMENADLAVYKAVMALKVAESASCTGAAAEVTATCDIDWQT